MIPARARWESLYGGASAESSTRSARRPHPREVEPAGHSGEGPSLARLAPVRRCEWSIEQCPGPGSVFSVVAPSRCSVVSEANRSAGAETLPSIPRLRQDTPASPAPWGEPLRSGRSAGGRNAWHRAGGGSAAVGPIAGVSSRHSRSDLSLHLLDAEPTYHDDRRPTTGRKPQKRKVNPPHATAGSPFGPGGKYGSGPRRGCRGATAATGDRSPAGAPPSCSAARRPAPRLPGPARRRPTTPR